MFLTPRYFLEMNDLKTDIFANWKILCFLIPAYASGAFFLHKWANNTALRFSYFLFLLYFVTLFFAFLFHFFSPLGLEHMEKNIISINNGSYLGIQQIIKEKGWFDVSFFQKIFFLLKDIYPTDCHYTVIGWTHPWGAALVTFVLFSIAKFLHPINSAFFLGVMITGLNAVLIPLIVLIIRRCSGEFWARKSSIFLIFIPSILFHISSLFEIMATVILALMILLSFLLIDNKNSLRKFFGLSFLWGACCLLVAQWGYGLVIPISAIFLFLIFNLQRNVVLYFIGVIAVLGLLFLGFEFLLSNGQSFYLARAISCVKSLGHFQEQARPYPLSQFANFTIISIMGGILFLPAFFSSIETIVSWKNKNQSWEFKNLSLAFVLSYTFLLLFIRTPLEVERTWHWVFIFSWPLLGNIIKEVKDWYWTLVVSQALISLALALTVQDYY